MANHPYDAVILGAYALHNICLLLTVALPKRMATVDRFLTLWIPVSCLVWLPICWVITR
jgi:hypothetical protein